MGISFSKQPAAGWITLKLPARIITLVILLFLSHSIVFAQKKSDSLNVKLSEITVTATPFGLTQKNSPIAFTQVNRSNLEVQTTPALSLDRLTTTIPGLWINNRENYALGERITLRGLGWRSAFGVRGIQIFLDGIPLTGADGQSVLTVVDPAFIRDIRLIRGPSSAFWGNSSGGILYLSTFTNSQVKPFVRLRETTGSYGLSKTDFQFVHTTSAQRYQFYGSYLSDQGYRDYSTVHLFRSGFTDQMNINNSNRLTLSGAFAAMPKAEHPGSLNAPEVTNNPRQARSYYQNSGAGKQADQGQVGGTLHSATAIGKVQTTLYGLFRELNNPLPFAYIRIHRIAGGTRLTLQNQFGNFNWGVGYGGKIQRDHRYNWENSNGIPRPGDNMTVDQMEWVYNHAFFGEGSYNVSSFTLNVGLRYDWLLFKNHDYLQQTGHYSQSGRRIFNAWSPSAGVTFHTGPTDLYANYRTAFEAPTTTELANRPDGSQGFNPNIGPEHINGFEIGLRGNHLLSQQFSYDLALFDMRVHDILVPYQGSNERTYYQNQGKTKHWGIEASLTWQPASQWRVALTYQYLKAVFESGFTENPVSMNGNRIPGVTPNRGAIRISYTGHRWMLSSDAELVDSYFVDNANTAKTGSYVDWNARISLIHWRPFEGIAVDPYLAAYNLLNSQYNGSVVVNATGGRYYEPAAGRHWAAGLAITFY